MLHQSPLADRLRPRNFAEFVGQEEIIGQGKLLRKLIESDQLPSLIFWGPPGVGKTTLAQIIANETKSHFATMSAVESGKSELLKIVESAKERLMISDKVISDTQYAIGDSRDALLGRLTKRTILFVDEIHRWNKAQQDALLPYVEKGIVTLIGATTENPSFEIIGALLSRCRVFVLKTLEPKDLLNIINRALADEERGLGDNKVMIGEEAKEFLAGAAGGDARVVLNALEIAVKAKQTSDFSYQTSVRGVKKSTAEVRSQKSEVQITKDNLKEALQRIHLVIDKRGEEFYNIISALHKSMRGSDATASLYWLARMLEGGCDPLYVARRVVRFASEDIGMANSEALVQAVAAYQACHFLGMPECSVHLAQAVVYCAKAKKSNLLYAAYAKAAKDARATSHLGVPLHIRNAPTKLMKDLEYGKGYKYNPDYDEPIDQKYLPPELSGRNYLSWEKKKQDE